MTDEEDSSKEKEDIEEPMIQGLQFNYSSWNLGGKLIFYSTLLAIFSMILPWIEGDGDTLGYQQGGTVFLALYIYPFVVLTMDKHFKTPLEYIDGILTIIIPSYFLYYMAEEMAAGILEAAGIGILLFILTGILLLIGMHRYERYDRLGVDEKSRSCPECENEMKFIEDLDKWYCEECDEIR